MLGLVVGVLVLAAPATAAAQTPAPPGEAYPPAAIVNLLDPFGCAPSTATGSIGAVLPGSTVNLELVLLSSPTPPLSTATATAGADGHAVYSIPVPPDRFGAAEVRATGTNTLNQPFAISSPGTLVPCPAGTPAAGGTLPTTGSSGNGDVAASGRRRGAGRRPVRGDRPAALGTLREQDGVMDESPTPSSGVDRREALKKAAVAAGVVAWTTPVVQVLSPGIAHAAVTGCNPVIVMSLQKTGPNCGCSPGRRHQLLQQQHLSRDLRRDHVRYDVPRRRRRGRRELPGVPKPGNCNVDRFGEFPCDTGSAQRCS